MDATRVHNVLCAVLPLLLLTACAAVVTYPNQMTVRWKGLSPPATAAAMEQATGESAAPVTQKKAKGLPGPTAAPAPTPPPHRQAVSGESASMLTLLLGLEQLRSEMFEQPVQLMVEDLLQQPALPNGCEITAATAMLHYFGYRVSKETMAETWLPRQEDYRAADPEQVYMGDPASFWQGFYCMTAPIVEAVNGYLTQRGDKCYRAVDLSGSDLWTLKTYLNNGYPVMVWVTRRLEPPRYTEAFTLPNGGPVYANLHCLILTGYADGVFTLSDPMGELETADRQTLETRYVQMGQRAVAILPC